MATLTGTYYNNYIAFDVPTTEAIRRWYGDFKNVTYSIFGDQLLVYPSDEGLKVTMGGSGRNRMQIPVGHAKHFLDFVPKRKYKPRFNKEFFVIRLEEFYE